MKARLDAELAKAEQELALALRSPQDVRRPGLFSRVTGRAARLREQAQKARVQAQAKKERRDKIKRQVEISREARRREYEAERKGLGSAQAREKREL